MQTDTLIAGGGLAGACAAFTLSRHGQSVSLLEADEPASGASGAAAGLVNPFMARRARPTWRMEAALDALRWTIREGEAEAAFDRRGVLRPARSEKQAGFFQEAEDTHPGYAQWLSADEAAERFPAVQSPHGALWIEAGGTADVPALIDALLRAAQQQGATVETGRRVTGWQSHSGGVSVEVERAGDTEVIDAQCLLLCVGQDFGRLPALASLDLRAVKGQTLRLRRPDVLENESLPGLSGNGYVVPHGDTLRVGSTYEHDFTDLSPTEEGKQYILSKVRQMLPALEGAEVLEARAGARVSPPSSHLPAVGPLPESGSQVWVFTALGSRGLLTAPLLARELLSYLDDPSRIPEAVRV